MPGDDHGETNKKALPDIGKAFTIMIVMINPFYPVMGLPPHFL